jgi:hypothetical protein
MDYESQGPPSRESHAVVFQLPAHCQLSIMHTQMNQQHFLLAVSVAVTIRAQAIS